MKKRILVIDDDLSTRLILHQVLNERYELTTLANGREALEWLLEGNVTDLVLTDLEMPQLSGNDFIKALSGHPLLEHLPVIVLSGCPKVEVEHLAASSRVQGVISKPFHYKTLLWHIAVALKVELST